ncbi:hypothetical protein [Micromonospora sp. KC723]|uniref:hypothetical protein n=1 Tax=Micromonospora sp. KC723 TaxID=2530381 RepID=UPI00104D860E|nr:hypothetical protein [Micromonospora sp. KC723]TDB71158.1 hypothetical protein E1165_23790 [Micromonospora sp. KC723]
MPVQRTVHPAHRASGRSSVSSQARLRSAVATLRDALAPDVALNLPAVLDEAALLACLSAILAETSTAVPAPDTRQPADTAATVIALPQTPAATPAPIDLNALNDRELQVIFYSSKLRYNSRQVPSHAELAAVVVDQINRLGLHVIKEIARQVHEAVSNCQWQKWEGLLPDREIRDDAWWLAHHFQLGLTRSAHTPAGAVAAWQHDLTTSTSQAVA